MNSTSTRPEGRLDELLKDLDESANSRTGEWVCQIWPEDAAYLAAVLRAGRELVRVVNNRRPYIREAGFEYTATLLGEATDNYDRAVAGTNAIAGGGDE